MLHTSFAIETLIHLVSLFSFDINFHHLLTYTDTFVSHTIDLEMYWKARLYGDAFCDNLLAGRTFVAMLDQRKMFG